MKIEELIEELSKYPENSNVYIAYSDDDGYDYVRDIAKVESKNCSHGIDVYIKYTAGYCYDDCI